MCGSGLTQRTTSNSRLSTAKEVKTPKALRLLFNDEIKYENTVSEYVLKGNGGKDRNSVLNTSYQKLQLRFQDALQVSSNEILIPSERRSRLRLVKVVY